MKWTRHHYKQRVHAGIEERVADGFQPRMVRIYCRHGWWPVAERPFTYADDSVTCQRCLGHPRFGAKKCGPSH